MIEYPDVRRRQFLLALQRALAAAVSEELSVGLLLIDLTNLRRINDLYGQQTGDITLALCREELAAISTEPENVFRIGSHHFAFILPRLLNPALIAIAANRVHGVLSTPLQLDDRHIHVRVHVGTATALGGESDAFELLSKAETSLSAANAGTELQFLDSQHNSIERAQNRLQLEESFIETLNGNALSLYYQPKIDLRSGQVNSCEALLRWPRPEGGYISPLVAIEMAESLNLGFTLNKWVVSEAVRQARRWQDSLGVSIAVNVEASLVSNPDLYNLLADTTAVWGTDRNLISVEVTESAVIDDKESGFQNLRRISELGIELAIDDFGTGYSSLSYFKHIPARELKVDQSFVRTIKHDAQNRALVKIIVEIAHLFGMTVVGEGVEDEETLRTLIDTGCDIVQGYCFSRPKPAAEFETWLQAWRARDADAPGVLLDTSSTR